MWPGNVRELQNVVIRSYYCCPEQMILPEHLGGSLGNLNSGVSKEKHAQTQTASAKESADDQEREKLLQLLRENNGDLQRTATALGISRATIYRRLSKYHINLKCVLQ